MFGLKISLLTLLIFVLFIGGLQFDSIDVANGQTESPFANCIMIIDKSLQVLLTMDEDCSQQQFSEAVSYYKANGFPHEGTYYDILGTKSMQLLTDYGNSLKSEVGK
jgi:hypothetical protein